VEINNSRYLSLSLLRSLRLTKDRKEVRVEKNHSSYREARAQAWARGQSFGPWVQGLPEDECRLIEKRRDEIIAEDALRVVRETAEASGVDEESVKVLFAVAAYTVKTGVEVKLPDEVLTDEQFDAIKAALGVPQDV
jgi:hypothetical protein